ncbi:MAG: hypothetical protein ACYDAG_11600 [Chloroflexota bacterium]
MDSSDPAEVMALASKLVALAREQFDALERGTSGQFQWLVLRRQEVTERIRCWSAGGGVLTAEEQAIADDLRAELAEVDAAMEEKARASLIEVKRSLIALRRSSKALTAYLTRGPGVPSYVDKRR